MSEPSSFASNVARPSGNTGPTIALLSGSVDSVTMLYQLHLQTRVVALFVDYAQRASAREHEVAQYHTTALHARQSRALRALHAMCQASRFFPRGWPRRARRFLRRRAVTHGRGGACRKRWVTW